MPEPIQFIDIIRLIEANMEDLDTPRRVVGLLRKYDGKPLTKVHSDLIARDIGVKVSIRKMYGMTNIDFAGKKDGEWESLLVAYKEKNVTIDTAWIIENNPSYFAAAAKRNDSRSDVLDDPALIYELVDHINEFHQILGRLGRLLKYDGPFGADRNSIIIKAHLEGISGL